MKANANSRMESAAKKAQATTWAFLWVIVGGIFFVVSEGAVSAADISSHAPVVEELNREEKRSMVNQLLAEGDRYLKEKNYNLANASYESIFLLEPSHLEASQRIDRLKKDMLREGRSETELVTRVYDQEIDSRSREYLEQAKELIAAGKWGRARFTLQKLLLINPLHEKARKLYDRLNREREAGAK